MSMDIESNDEENRRLVFGLLELLNKLEMSEANPLMDYGDESLIADLQDATAHLGDLGFDRGVEILVSILAKGKINLSWKEEH